MAKGEFQTPSLEHSAHKTTEEKHVNVEKGKSMKKRGSQKSEVTGPE